MERRRLTDKQKKHFEKLRDRALKQIEEMSKLMAELKAERDDSLLMLAEINECLDKGMMPKIL